MLNLGNIDHEYFKITVGDKVFKQVRQTTLKELKLFLSGYLDVKIKGWTPLTIRTKLPRFLSLKFVVSIEILDECPNFFSV